MPYFRRTDDIELFYTDGGEGPPVLLVHGWCCDSHDYSWLIPALTDDHRVIAVDLRGHGRSSTPEGSYHPEELADDLAALITEIGAVPTVVIGHSLGTVIASALAVRSTDLVSGLVLIDAVYGNDDSRIDQVLEMMTSDAERGARAVGFGGGFYGAQTPAFLPVWHRRRAQGVPRRVSVACLEGMFSGRRPLGRREVAREYLLGRNCPRLAVFRRAALAEFEASLPSDPRDEIHVWPEAGHFLHVEQPERFASLVRAWLARLPEQRAVPRSPPV